jgi:nucleotide-binding universal stress UspA family protein
MYRRILIPTDGSRVSRNAAKQGIALAKRLRATVVGFFCAEDYRKVVYSELVPPIIISEREFQALSKQTAAKRLGFIADKAKAAGVRFEGYYDTGLTPWEAIIAAAKKQKCDLICIGSHGRSGLAGVILGSQAAKVLTHSKLPVLVIR